MLFSDCPECLQREFRLHELEKQNETLRVERDTFSGAACANGQIEGKAPCGICVRCLAAERNRLREAVLNVLRQCNTEPRALDEYYKIIKQAALRREVE